MFNRSADVTGPPTEKDFEQAWARVSRVAAEGPAWVVASGDLTPDESRLYDYFETGRTLAGPHRSAFLVTHGPKNVAAENCSTGEQKALLIGMILAHARAVRDNFHGYAPLLLLDEIAAHLDAERRAGLFAELRELGAQAFMTGTDELLFAAARDDAAFLRIAAGELSPSTHCQ